MKAAVVQSPGKLVVLDVPEPMIDDYGILCRLLFGATCSGTDQHLIADRMPWKVEYPMVLGHESIGRVVQVGSRVRHFRAGDLVTRVGTTAMPNIRLHVSWGGFSEMGLAKDYRAMRDDGLPEESWTRFRINQLIPAHYNPAACTMIITWRETLSYTRRLGVGPGSRVLVLGSGGNAMAFVAHARNLGAGRIACVGSASREIQTRRAGATHYFDYHAADAAEAIRRSCGEFDFIIDAVGKSGQVNRVLALLKHEGMIGIYGLDDFDALHIDPLRAKGTFAVYGGGYDEEETHDEVIARMADGSLDASIWLDLEHPFALENISDAFAAIRSRRLVKALVRLSAD